MTSSSTPLHPAPVGDSPVAQLGTQALRYLGLHPDNPATYALALLARRYELDPLINEISVISGKAYITRDGMLTIAHRSGQFDGITVDDLHEGDSGWGCTVTVWRKDMSHGFTYSAGCGKQEPQAKQGFGPEMALARAERRALHRAFNIPSGGGDYDDAGFEPQVVMGEVPPAVGGAIAVDAEAGIPAPPRPRPDPEFVFVTPTPEQARRVKELRGRLPQAETGATWYRYVSDIVGRTVTNTRQLSRSDTDELIWRMEADLTPDPEPPPGVEHDEP